MTGTTRIHCFCGVHLPKLDKRNLYNVVLSFIGSEKATRYIGDLYMRLLGTTELWDWSVVRAHELRSW